MSVCGSGEFETPVVSDCFNVNGAWKPLYNFSFWLLSCSIINPTSDFWFFKPTFYTFKVKPFRQMILFLWRGSITNEKALPLGACWTNSPKDCSGGAEGGDPMSTWYLLVVTVGRLRAQTHDLSFVGRYNWGWRGVDISSCLQGRNKDLTPAAVQRRHQLGLEPDKMSFTSPINTSILPAPQPHVSLLRSRLYFTLVPQNFFPPHPLLLLSFPPLHPSSASATVPPSLLPLVSSSSHWRILSSDTTLIFLPTFLPSLNISLCGTVALDFCDDFIPPLLAWVAVNSSGEWGLSRVASVFCYKCCRRCNSGITLSDTCGACECVASDIFTLPQQKRIVSAEMWWVPGVHHREMSFLSRKAKHQTVEIKGNWSFWYK